MSEIDNLVEQLLDKIREHEAALAARRSAEAGYDHYRMREHGGADREPEETARREVKETILEIIDARIAELLQDADAKIRAAFGLPELDECGQAPCTVCKKVLTHRGVCPDCREAGDFDMGPSITRGGPSG